MGLRTHRKVKAGTACTYTVKDDGEEHTVVLSVVEPGESPADTMVFDWKGPFGMGLSFDFPLDGSKDASDVKDKVDVEIGAGGISLDFNDGNLKQLRGGGPATLSSVVGEAGKGLVVRTR